MLGTPHRPGKSSVVESIRAVLGLDAIGDDAQRAHQGIVRHVIKRATKISLLVRVHRPETRQYLIERTIPDPPLVRDVDGQVSNLTPRDILPRVELYGQHEILELTKSREKLTRLVDRFVEPDHDTPRRKAELRGELEKNRRGVVDAQTELGQIEERLSALPRLEETLERFRDAGIEERLKEQSLSVREERVITSIPERLAPLRLSLETLQRELPLDRVFLSEKALKELPGREILGRANDVLERLDPELARIAADLGRALERADEGIAEVRIAWEGRRAIVQTEYESILRELHKSRIDGEEFIRLRRQIEALRPLFGVSPNKYLPHAGISAAAYPGTEKDYNATERTSLRGPLVSLFSEPLERIGAKQDLKLAILEFCRGEFRTVKAIASRLNRTPRTIQQSYLRPMSRDGKL